MFPLGTGDITNANKVSTKCFEKRDYSNLAKVQPKVATAIQQFISFFGEPEGIKGNWLLQNEEGRLFDEIV